MDPPPYPKQEGGNAGGFVQPPACPPQQGYPPPQQQAPYGYGAPQPPPAASYGQVFSSYYFSIVELHFYATSSKLYILSLMRNNKIATISQPMDLAGGYDSDAEGQAGGLGSGFGDKAVSTYCQK